ncbi:MAG: class I adenylate-forming enzyme family protein, partial [Planctomycetota bacterium]
MKIIDLLQNSSAAEPHRTAIRSGDSEISYEQVDSLVFRLSDRLRAVGCRSGVKVAVVLDNSAEYLISFFAVSAAEGIIVPLSSRMAPIETAGYIDRTDVSIVITNRAIWKRTSERLHICGKVTVIYVERAPEGNLELETGALGDCNIDRENSDVALMLPTSGTTGRPKIVMLTDSNLLSNMSTYRSLMGFDGHNTVFCALSLHHIYCICAQILTHISRADTFVLSSGPFFAKDFLKAVGAYGITITAFVPYMAILLAEYPDPGSFDIESLKYVTLSGAKTPRSTCELLNEKYADVQFISTYGMSEAGSRVSIARPSSERFPVESVGRPMPGIAVRIVCEKGNDVPAN